MNDEIYETLKATARDQDITYYSDIAPLAGLDMSNPEDRNRIADLLGEISLQEHRERHPLLSVVVIHKEDNKPGPGFFTLARDLGLYSGDNDFKFFIEELRRVHDFWKNTR